MVGVATGKYDAADLSVTPILPAPPAHRVDLAEFAVITKLCSTILLFNKKAMEQH